MNWRSIEEMKLKMIPCKECLVLAICRNKYVVNCSLLYDYIMSSKEGMEYGIARKQLGYSNRFREPGRVPAARKIFNEAGEFVWL
jgi:hypothetical protein